MSATTTRDREVQAIHEAGIEMYGVLEWTRSWTMFILTAPTDDPSAPTSKDILKTSEDVLTVWLDRARYAQVASCGEVKDPRAAFQMAASMIGECF